MLISHLSNSVRYTGRWAKREDAAITTACGSMFEIAFSGRECTLLFDMKTNSVPYPHIYIQVDGGALVDVPVDYYVRVKANDFGNHVLKAVVSCSVETSQRWYEPLVSKVSFKGAECDGEGVLPCDNRDVIEFVGDSITEGVWVEYNRSPDGNYSNSPNRVFQNDVTATYAYLTAEALDMRPWIMGYGSVGFTKSGGGGVPKAIESYPYAFAGNNYEPSGAKVIVINHGTNDANATKEEYLTEYEKFIKLVRRMHPQAKIVALCAFMEFHNDEVGIMVKRYNAENDDEVVCIDTSGWIPLYPIHPTREGHRIVSEKLVPEIKKILEK